MSKSTHTPESSEHPMGWKPHERLKVSACSSYIRHFGPNAVEAAEGDALGTSIALLNLAMRTLVKTMEVTYCEGDNDLWLATADVNDAISAYLARTETKDD